jgi:transposase
MGAPTGAPARRSAAGRPVGRSPDGDQRDLLPRPDRLSVAGPAGGVSGTGRPSITGIAAGRWTGPGSRCWTGCGPEPAAFRPLTMTTRGASANDKKSGREAIGRSRGGLTTKVHLAADLCCRPVARLSTPGQHGDCPRFIPLMDAIAIRRRGPGRPRRRPGRVMADKAYCWLATAPGRGSAASRRSSRSRRTRRSTAATAGGPADGRQPSTPGWYSKRSTVERCLSKLRQFRAVATRYDKRERIYQGTIDVAPIRIWLRDPVTPIAALQRGIR